MPDFDVTIKLRQLQEYERELATAKARSKFLENTYTRSIAEITHQQLLEAKQDIIDALKDKVETLNESADNLEDLVKKRNIQVVYLNNQVINLKSALAVEVSNVCDLDQEKQDLIEVLADRNGTITCLKADKARLEKQLAATIARDTSFTLSGDYQVTKISKGGSLKSYKEMYPDRQTGFPPHLNENDLEFDNDINDEPDPSIGW
jgi:chromosome condensin MukBEF ATPase and DNA-binding subunit MukB